MKFSFFTKSLFTFLFLIIHSPNLTSQDDQRVFEEVIVTAEKRSESLQSVSQAVTAISDSELENKKIGLSLLNGSYLEGEVVAIDNNGDLVLKIKSDENKIIKSGMVHKMEVNK